MAKIERKGVNSYIRQSAKGEWQIMLGNKIMSRHLSEQSARAAFKASQAA